MTWACIAFAVGHFLGVWHQYLGTGGKLQALWFWSDGRFL